MTTHETSRQEIVDLLALVDRDLRDSGAEGIGADWRLNIAYNAALQAARAALAAAGFRPGRSGNAHYYTLQSLAHTVGIDDSSLRRLEAFRKRRNMSEYDRAGVTSTDEANEMRDLAMEIRRLVLGWLSAMHPRLVP